MTRLFYFFLFYYIFTGAVFAVTPTGIIKKAEKTFLNAKTIAADFNLTINWSLKETVEEKKGKLFFKHPEKYRIELDRALFISNGETFYRYSSRTKQLVVNDILDIRSDFQPGEWLFKYSDKYKPVSMESAVLFEKKCFGVTLVPKKKARFDKLRVWIDNKSGLARKIETTDKNENIATYLITYIAKNTELKNSLFTFTPPKGTEIIDMRE
jgi:outer membrane lipoprotein-sorting protein